MQGDQYYYAKVNANSLSHLATWVAEAEEQDPMVDDLHLSRGFMASENELWIATLPSAC